MARVKVVRPFRTPEDETAFYRMQTHLGPEDQDLMAEIENRRDAVTRLLHPSDMVRLDRLVGKLFLAYAECTRPECKHLR